MTIVRRNLWLGAVIFSFFFLAVGAFFVAQGADAKAEVRAELAAEKIITAKDASLPGVLVDNAETAWSEAEVIKEHTLKSTEGKTYAEMDREDPKRDLYIKSVVLRTALSQAYMGFKVADLVIGVGILTIALGVATLSLGAPALYWAGRDQS